MLPNIKITGKWPTNSCIYALFFTLSMAISVVKCHEQLNQDASTFLKHEQPLELLENLVAGVHGTNRSVNLTADQLESIYYYVRSIQDEKPTDKPTLNEHPQKGVANEEINRATQQSTSQQTFQVQEQPAVEKNESHKTNKRKLKHESRGKIFKQSDQQVVNQLWNSKINKKSQKQESKQQRSGPKVEQPLVIEFPVEFWQYRDTIIPYSEAFLKGARLYDYAGYLPFYWSNTSNCMYALSNLTWIDFPFSSNYILSSESTPWPMWQNGTLFLRELAQSLYICNDMTKNTHAYIAQRLNLFQYDILTWSYSFLQNVLAKILSVNNIYASLSSAINNNITIIIYFDVARLLRTLLIFDPIEMENPEDDWYFDPNGTYSDSAGYWQYQILASNPALFKNGGEGDPDLVSFIDFLRSTAESLFGERTIGGDFGGFQNYLKSEFDTYLDEKGKMRHLTVEQDATQTYYVQLIVQYILEGLAGFAIGVAVINGPSFSQCTSQLNNYGLQAVKIYTMYRAEWDNWVVDWQWRKFRIWPYLLINDEWIWFLYHLYDLSNGCFYGGFEFYDSLLDYVDWYYEPTRLLWNLLFNFGFIYVNVRDIVMFILRDERTLIEDSFGIGRSLGQIYYFIFISNYYSQVFQTLSSSQLQPTSGLPIRSRISQSGDVIQIEL